MSIEPALTGNEGDSIESVDVSVDPAQAGDLSVDNVSVDGYRIILWVSGGQANVTYTVTIKASLTSGRTLQRSLLLPVLPLSIAAIPANAIQTSTQDALDDQNGDPVVTS